MTKRFINPKTMEATARLSKVAADAGMSVTTLAVAWTLSHDFVGSTIIGATHPDQLEDTLAAADVTLPAEILAAILKQSTEATLVGQPTFGLAGRRGLIDLPNGSLVVMTDALYASPDGEPIDERLRPDELVRATLRSLADEDVSLDDLMLERAVEVLARAGEKAA